jgi:hypothetical protein
MTISIGRTVFTGSGHFCRMVFFLLAMAGCTSSNIDGAAPAVSVSGAKDTGSYPNLNIAPQVAAKQFTNEEKTANLAQLKADGQTQASKGGAANVADPAALSALAKKHGADTLKQIEGKCDPALDPTCK